MPARHFQQFRDVIARPAHTYIAVGADGEKGHAFSGVRFRKDLLHGLRLFGEKRVGGRLPACEKPIELYPLHAPQRVRLVTGTLHEYRDAQRLQLFPYVGAVENHGGFHRQRAVCR